MEASPSMYAILLAWTSAFVIVETITNTFLWWQFRMSPNSTVHEYYTKVPVPIVILGDYSYSTVILLTTMAIFKQYRGTNFASLEVKDIARFALIFIAVQWVFDITWATLVFKLRDKKVKNKYVDFFARYGREVGMRAVLGDSVYLLAWLILTVSLLYKSNELVKYLLISIGLFLATIFSYP